ncbi:MAG: ATP-binding cassette domain-containing protein [Lachnospiraceae bacterium]|nr:ATP-binding cassette domain-containing protein [Lachnospiraceae bacterium]
MRGWFDEQIRQRKKNDNDVFEDSFVHIASAIEGKLISAALNNERQLTADAIFEIMTYYHVKKRDIPDSIKDISDQLEYLMRPSGIMRRVVTLEGEWYKNAVGAMLGFRKDDGSVVALIPAKFSGYTFYDKNRGKYVKVNKNNKDILDEEAIAFYKPFPLRALKTVDILTYLSECISKTDILRFVFASLIVVLIGMALPELNRLLVAKVVPLQSKRLLFAMGFFMITVSLSSLMVGVIKGLLLNRIATKISINVSAAGMMRLLSLKTGFFKKYTAGDLSNRMDYLEIFCDYIVNMLFSTGITTLFSFMYVAQIMIYAPSLVVPALLVIVANIILTLIVAAVKSTRTIELEKSAELSGLDYAMICGIQKIKLAGAEKRAFARWGEKYTEQAKEVFNPPKILTVNVVLTTGISLIGTIAIYYLSVTNKVSVSDYYAFSNSYGMISSALMVFSQSLVMISSLKPYYDMVKPIMKEVPEIGEDKAVVTRLSGSINISHVTFRYNEHGPKILDDLSLRINSGQYVAIVGSTGCGKSTLLRLLLGFETPELGAIYYDGKDLETIDLKSLRHRIGTVMQNDRLFQGDIFANITISAPELDLDGAWEACEIAGVADDIREMPMGMNTVISEGAGGISGGQRQRLIIARAIAPKPKILMFDEATSALDNLTQKHVSDALSGLKCTRIVVAHRLSTIKDCDRIIVLDKGKIIEDGTYDELIGRKGFFAELVERQRLDTGSVATV